MDISIQGLILVEKNGRTCPFLSCGICHKVIKQGEADLDSAVMIFWNFKGEGMSAHKKCVNKFRNYDTVWPNSMELPEFFYDILWNSKIKPKRNEWDIIP